MSIDKALNILLIVVLVLIPLSPVVMLFVREIKHNNKK